jgi:D-3-phosphoglycerate dehydrogenase
MIRILITDKLSPKAIDNLNEIPEFEVEEKTGLSAADLQNEIRYCDAVVIRSATKLNAAILAHAENLKLIVRAGIGLDNVDIESAQKHHILVRNTPLATAITVAEYTLALMLACARHLGPAYTSMKAHLWRREALSSGTELFGKTAGIIGFGRIGRAVGQRLSALGMELLFNDILEIHSEIKAQQVSLSELLRRSDFVTLHVPLTDKTRGLIGANELRQMKANAILINAARGGVVDEEALRLALTQKQIQAAALDVFSKEPSDNFALIDQEGIFAVPHLGAATDEGQERAGLEAVAILKDFFNV